VDHELIRWVAVTLLFIMAAFQVQSWSELKTIAIVINLCALIAQVGIAVALISHTI
jgi:hypothetical protein